MVITQTKCDNCGKIGDSLNLSFAEFTRHPPAPGTSRRLAAIEAKAAIHEAILFPGEE